MPNNDELMTAAEVAEHVGVHAETVLRWSRDNLIPFITLPSGRKRFRRSDVEALLEKQAS